MENELMENELMENTTENEEVENKENDAKTNDEAENVEELNTAEEKKQPQEDYKEKYYYLAAEIQNMQRRFEKEKDNLLKYGSEKILRDILDVVDNLERTLGFIKNDEDAKVKNIVVGIEMIEKMFMDILSKHGLKRINALGEEFDPNFHEALSQEPAEGKKNMEVIQVHQNGYTLNDRVIRAAKVVVAKND
ncbi:MAG: nucleotide exchange factor GrpE [Bacteriovoracaceae bacterium]|nr:nucleotide exchange factor GrpE [Bacteriovoracaceae bacterium]